MRKVAYLPYLCLLFSLFVLLSLPRKVTEEVRSFAVSSFSPCWRGVDWMKKKTLFVLSLPLSEKNLERKKFEQEKETLLQELFLLRSQMENVREWLVQESRLQEEMRKYEKLEGNKEGGDFFRRRAEEIRQILRLGSKALPAKISFRQPSFWSSALWINVGEKHNARLGKQVIGKNSPVILGSSLIGLVEYVGNSQSRVRLITDPSLGISVRAVRGGEQNRYLFDQIQSLLFCLDSRSDLFSSLEEKNGVMALLFQLRKRIEGPSPDLYLAKGELKGYGTPLWRSRQVKLRGVGFNYDFADTEGPARHLLSGQTYENTSTTTPIRLIEKGDLLVTTGLDSLFPAGLKVATVSCVEPLREGASSYEIEAIPLVSNLDTLSDLFVLPPLQD